jgi:hypothetical protein
VFVYLLTEYHPDYPCSTVTRADVVKLVTRHHWPLSAFRVRYYPR